MIIYDIKQERFSIDATGVKTIKTLEEEKIVKLGIICPKDRIGAVEITIDKQPIELGYSGIYEIQSETLEKDKIPDLLMQIDSIAEEIILENKNDYSHKGEIINIDAFDSSKEDNDIIINYVIVKTKN